jgi:hypothetical protein
MSSVVKPDQIKTSNESRLDYLHRQIQGRVKRLESSIAWHRRRHYMFVPLYTA